VGVASETDAAAEAAAAAAATFSSSYPIKTTSKKDIKALGLMPNGLCWPHHSPRAPVVFEDPEWDEQGIFPLLEWKHGQA